MHSRRSSNYTWCKVDRCESDGRTVNWKDKSCTESTASPGPGFFNRSLNPTCNDVFDDQPSGPAQIVPDTQIPHEACTLIGYPPCGPGYRSCGWCMSDCCPTGTPSTSIQGVSDIGLTYEEMITETTESLLSVPLTEDGKSLSIREIVINTLHFRKNGNCILLTKKSKYFDGIEDTSNKSTPSSVCGTYQIDNNNIIFNGITIINGYYFGDTRIKNRLGADLLYDNVRIELLKSNWNELIPNSRIINGVITGTAIFDRTGQITSDVPFYHKTIEHSTYKKVNKGNLFTGLCGGGTPTVASPPPSNGRARIDPGIYMEPPPSTSEGGGCSIM